MQVKNQPVYFYVFSYDFKFYTFYVNHEHKTHKIPH